MVSSRLPTIELDSVHCSAICNEVGHRLDQYFKKDVTEPPPELKQLLARLKQLDRRD